MEKTCSKCKEVKTTKDFYRDPRVLSGLYAACKACHGKMNTSKHYSPEWHKEIQDSVN